MVKVNTFDLGEALHYEVGIVAIKFNVKNPVIVYDCGLLAHLQVYKCPIVWANQAQLYTLFSIPFVDQVVGFEYSYKSIQWWVYFLQKP